MTPEEEEKLQERLGEAADIRERIEESIKAMAYIREGLPGLNASIYCEKYEAVGRALSFVKDDVIKLLTSYVMELKEKYKKL